MDRRKFISLASLVSTASLIDVPRLISSPNYTQGDNSPEKLSRDIAQYVQSHSRYRDKKIRWENEIRRKLNDRRLLTVCFKGVSYEDTSIWCSLEINLQPISDDQFGYFTRAQGLKGRCSDFRILTGQHSEIQIPITAWSPFDESSFEKYIQDKYFSLLEYVHMTLLKK